MVERGATDEVCIVGMGYVGTSLAAVFAESGLTVHGIDTNPDVVSAVEDERCPIEEDRISELFERHTARGNISASRSAAALDGCDVIIVTVGTPLSEEDPDLSSVEAASEQVGRHLSTGDLVMFRSTLPAGATEDAIRPTLDEASGLTAGDDYSLAFCPERMAEGSARGYRAGQWRSTSTARATSRRHVRPPARASFFLDRIRLRRRRRHRPRGRFAVPRQPLRGDKSQGGGCGPRVPRK